MTTYLFKLKHDKGTVSLYVIADNEEIAKQIVMENERCPERAIYSIRKINKLKICI